ncbi:MAG TPA: alpha/beta hydrolase [Candidatus Limnocylindria bacterium]|nr:alpha/beta hydrolase [Candidatus Limnocylindria bacterium]
MPYELPPDPSTARRTRMGQWVTFGFAALLVALAAYFAYLGYEGSRQFADAPSRPADCRTPATFGWEYEAINYDQASDAELASEADPEQCVGHGARAGSRVAGPGGVGLAGWYVPAASGAPPSAPTVVLAHGWGSNKSVMLDRAALLHDAYHLVLFDFRNHGQSAGDVTTQGVREAGDIRAILDWLESQKGPDRIAVLGTSMGGASALAAADRDDRIDALVVESTHATIANAIQARLDRAGYPLAIPGSWAILLASLFRTGEDASSVDPLLTIARLEERPVLLVYGGLDDTIGAADAQDLEAAAAAAGSPIELHVCEAAGHAQSPDACPEDYPGWVLGFLERVLASG